MICSIETCDRKAKSRGWCPKHYWRWWKNGDPLFMGDNTGKSATDRFNEKVLKYSGTYDCWEWIGTVSKKGYGMFWPTNKGIAAHRYSYEIHVGPIPDGLQIDHLCRNRRCVNPEHLEPVTNAENRERSPLSPEKRTHCPQGHEYTDANTLVGRRKSGTYRTCKECRRLAQIKRRAAS